MCPQCHTEVVQRDEYWICESAECSRRYPIVDDIPPVVTPPSDRTVDATGYLTAVDLGAAVAQDVLEGLITAIPRLVELA